MPATRLRIVLVTCILLFIIMEGAKPVMGKKGKRKGTKARVKVLEQKVEEMENLLNCEACSKIEQLTERLNKIDDEIEKLKNPPTTSPPPPPTTSPPPPPTTPAPSEWHDYTPQWCGGSNRRFIQKGINEDECKQRCANCAAIEYWSGSKSCFECLDHTKRRPYTYTNDGGYPPHVFVRLD